MKYSLFILLAFLSLPLSACWGEGAIQDNKYAVVIETPDSQHQFDVELAMTLQEQSKGLMYRTEMAEEAGMLFYFGDEAERGFWMKNTLIPLDMIFIKADGVIHHIHSNAIPGDLTSIKSQGPVAAVLEINGGLANKLGINVGNTVKHPFFNAKEVQ